MRVLILLSISLSMVSFFVIMYFSVRDLIYQLDFPLLFPKLKGGFTIWSILERVKIENRESLQRIYVQGQKPKELEEEGAEATLIGKREDGKKDEDEEEE